MNRRRLTIIFYTLVVSFVFIIVAIKLFNKTPHGIISIYSVDRFFFGLAALSPDQILSFIIILAGYWVALIIYSLIVSYILDLGFRKSIIFALLLGLDIHISLSLFDLAVHNIHWSLNYNTYYDPVFIYLLLGIYAVIIVMINILISRSTILSIIDFIKAEKTAPHDFHQIIFFLPLVILTAYSFMLLRFNSVILLLIAIILFVEMFITSRASPLPSPLRGEGGVRGGFSNERIFLYAVAIFTLLIRLAFSLANQYGMGADDSPYYDDLGWRYASGENVKDLFYPPGYWMYLGVFYKTFGHNQLALMIFQSLIGSTLPLLTYFIAREIFSIKIARLSAILVSVNSSIIFYSTIISPESIYTPLTLLSIWLLLKGCKYFYGDKPLHYNIFLSFIIIGVSLGLSIIIKPVIIVFPFVILGWMFLTYPYRTRTILTSWVLLIVIICLVITPIAYRNYVNYNKFILITGFEQVKNTLNNPYLEKAGIYGDSYGEIFTNLISRPFSFFSAYVKGAPLQLGNLFWGKKNLVPFDIIYLHMGSPYAFNLKVYFALLSILGIFVSMVMERGKWKERLLPLSLIAYYCAMYIFFYGKNRYAMPMLPLVVMFGTSGFYYILTKTRGVFNPLIGSMDDGQQRIGERFKIASCGGIALIVIFIYGLNYSYNSKADKLLQEGKQLIEAGDYIKAKEALQGVIRVYPNSVSAQYAYHDLIISGAKNMNLQADILNGYFLSYKGFPQTIETFKELINIFQKFDNYYFKRLETSSDLKRFEGVFDFQEAVILDVSYDYPHTDQIVEMTCQFLHYLQNMRTLVKIKVAEDSLKDRMPDFAEKEFKDIIGMPEQKVIRQWFSTIKCK